MTLNLLKFIEYFSQLIDPKKKTRSEEAIQGQPKDCIIFSLVQHGYVIE